MHDHPENPENPRADPDGESGEPPPPPKTPLREKHDPYLALRYANYRYYTIGQFVLVLGRQMLGVAIAWEIYEITRSATALGLVGLLHALPLLLLSLPAGQLADRFSRKGIVMVSLAAGMLLSFGLAWVSAVRSTLPELPILTWANEVLLKVALVFERHGDPNAIDFSDPALPLMYLLIFLIGVVRVISNPARASLLPQLIPLKVFSSAVTWNSSIFQIASMAGPALGGFLIVKLGFSHIYIIDGLCSAIMFFLLIPITYRSGPKNTEKITLATLLAGLVFVWKKKVILAAITLDLFAVLLGGAVALLPIYADQILHVGAIGLGWLRAAPAIGAFVAALCIAHLPPMKRPGVVLLWAVAGFGLAIVVFGWSSVFWLSLFMLFLTGVFDNISVVVRMSLVQLLTQDSMRGRVSAVNQVFIGSSNELGAFRAGMMAALLGPVVAVVAGGVGTILVVLGVARLWPQVTKIDPLHKLRPD